MLAIHQTVVGLAEYGLLLLRRCDMGQDTPCLGDEVDLAFGVVA